MAFLDDIEIIHPYSSSNLGSELNKQQAVYPTYIHANVLLNTGI